MSVQIDPKPLIVWVVSQNVAGTLNQPRGVAEHIVAEPIIKLVQKERRLKRWFAPFRQNKNEVEPDIILSCGQSSERFVRIIKEAFGGRPYAVHLQHPIPKDDCYDLVFVSSHDWKPEFEGNSRLHQMLGAPHRVNAAKLAKEREAARKKWAPAGGPVLTFLIGGPNKAFQVDESVMDSLVSAAEGLLARGWTVLSTVSRRSPPGVAEQLGRIRDPNFKLWNFQGDNPYFEYMAAADAFLVTEDSITMASEAVSSGKPVYVMPLAIKDDAVAAAAAKFRRFHADLRERGVARPFEGQIEHFSYVVFDETKRVANVVKEAYARRAD